MQRICRRGLHAKARIKGAGLLVFRVNKKGAPADRFRPGQSATERIAEQGFAVAFSLLLQIQRKTRHQDHRHGIASLSLHHAGGRIRRHHGSRREAAIADHPLAPREQIGSRASAGLILQGGVPGEILISITVAASTRSLSPKSKELWLWFSLSVVCKGTNQTSANHHAREAYGLQ